MEPILEIKMRNSECKMPKSRRVLLTYERQGLVPCKLEETIEVTSEFQMPEGWTSRRLELTQQLAVMTSGIGELNTKLEPAEGFHRQSMGYAVGRGPEIFVGAIGGVPEWKRNPGSQ